MTEQEMLAEIERNEEKYLKQIELRDKLITTLIAQCESMCEECALKCICFGGAKYETCARGLLAKLIMDEAGV